MSNDKHTPTPWRFDKTLEYIFDANDDYPILEANSFEAAERAVQCVNACEGLSDEDLTVKVQIQLSNLAYKVDRNAQERDKAEALVESLRAEKAELIEALRAAQNLLVSEGWIVEGVYNTLAKYETK